jgi:hypothetical protein
MGKVTSISDNDKGVFTVYTSSGSRYIIDTDAMSIRRHEEDMSDWAMDLRRAAEHTVVFLRECVVGKPVNAVIEARDVETPGAVSDWFSSAVIRIVKQS